MTEIARSKLKEWKINTTFLLYVLKANSPFICNQSAIRIFIGNQEGTLEQLYRRDKWKLLLSPAIVPLRASLFPHLYSFVTKSFYWLSSEPRLILRLSNGTPAKGVVFLTKLADLVYQLVRFLLTFLFFFWFLRTPILVSSFSLIFFSSLSCFPECSFSVLMRVRGKILRSFILVLSTEWERGI